MTAPQALAHVRVIELCTSLGGAYSGKLLADMGAEVWKIEAPRLGDPSRHRRPFLQDLPDAEHSGLFAYLHTNKCSLTLDVRVHTGRAILHELLRQADVLLEDMVCDTSERPVLDYTQLQSRYPHLIITSLTPFGRTGPHHSYKATTLTLAHAGGEAYTLPGGAELGERPPVKPGGRVSAYDGGLSAAVATLAALYGRAKNGGGQHIDVSAQEAVLALARIMVGRYTADGLVNERVASGRRLGSLIRCKDGYILLRPLDDRLWQSVVRMMDTPSWASWEEYATTATRAQHVEELNQLIEAWAQQYSMRDIHQRALAHHCPAGYVATAADLLESPQLQARGFFTTMQHPVMGAVVLPAGPYQYSETPWSLRRPAPLLGEHNDTIYGGVLGVSREELVYFRRIDTI